MKAQKYTFVCEKACRSHSADGRELWTVTVRAAQLPLGLKFGPNARYASLSSRPAKDMLQTLESTPESFVFKNNGIMVVANSIKVEGNQVDITCHEPEEDEDAPGHGVLNGGHTYKVLQHALMSESERFARVGELVSVIVTIAIGVPEEEIWTISRARNTSEKVPLHALRELAGDWTILKDHLPAASRSLVAFKPNDPEAPNEEYDVTDLVRRLVLLNNTMFPAERGEHPVKAYTSIGTVVKQFKQQDFLGVAHLLPDIIHLEELVVNHFYENNGKGADKMWVTKASGVTKEPMKLLSGAIFDLSLPAPFVLPVIAAFRVFVKDGSWVEPIDELWRRFGPRTAMALWEAYREQGKSSPAVFGRSKSSWAAACDLTKSAAIQMQLITVQ
jgi:hypothetical protein